MQDAATLAELYRQWQDFYHVSYPDAQVRQESMYAWRGVCVSRKWRPAGEVVKELQLHICRGARAGGSRNIPKDVQMRSALLLVHVHKHSDNPALRVCQRPPHYAIPSWQAPPSC